MRIAPLPSASAPTVASVLLSEFSDGEDLDEVLLVRSAELRDKKAGGSFLRLSLGDRSGALTGMVWDDYDREWKGTQRRFTQLEMEVTRQQLAAATKGVDVEV